MAWRISFFLKYLISLEEFRKNPHVNIPPKSPCANFQSHGIFKNLIFIRKEIFFNIQPNWPSGQPAHPAFLAPSIQAGRVGPPGHAPPSPSSLPHQASSAAPSSRAATAPWTLPLLLPLHRAATVTPLTPPPSSIGRNSSPPPSPQ
jgi:hypothetical protein